MHEDLETRKHIRYVKTIAKVSLFNLKIAQFTNVFVLICKSSPSVLVCVLSWLE